MANPIAELVFIPAPGFGHLMSIIEFAKALVTRDLHLSITVLVIHPPPQFGGSAVTAFIESLSNNTMDRISFIELPQDKTPPISKAFMLAMSDIINRHCKYVRKFVADKMSQSTGSSPVVGFVIDMFCTAMIDVANEVNLPTYVFYGSSACILGFKLHIQKLYDDLKQDVNELSNSDSMITVPSFVNQVPWKVFRLKSVLEKILRLLWSLPGN